MRKAFSFYRSHYEQMKLLNKTQVADITLAICEVQFLEIHINDIKFKDKMTQLVWTGIKHAIDASVTGYGYAKGNSKIPLEGGSEILQTPPEQEEVKEEVKEEEEVEYTGLNSQAFKMWCKHKGSKYSKQGKTISRNKLLEFDEATQLKMVENSIMNNYAGLFELKQPPTQNRTTPTTTNSTIDKFFNGTAESEIIDARIN